jgi:hypothetical protein
MATPQQIYDQSVRPLPPSERLRLATIILEDLASSASAWDYADSWSDEDVSDLTRFAQRGADKAYPEERELA